MNKYELMYEIIQESFDNGKITLEEAEFLNDYAYDRYITEDGHSKKLKARHNAQKRNIEKRFYDNMNFKYDHRDMFGRKCGTVKREDGPEVPITISNKGPLGSAAYYTDGIHMSRKAIRMKGSDLTGSHEYSHMKDYEKTKRLMRDKFQKKDDEVNEKMKKILNSDASIAEKDKADKEINKYWERQRKTRGKYQEKIYKKVVQDDGWKDTAKDVNKRFKINNNHDKRAEEMHADHYALTTTKGKNNSNRYKKRLNEIDRRIDQSNKDITRNRYEEMKKEMMDNQNDSSKTKYQKMKSLIRDKIKTNKAKRDMNHLEKNIKNNRAADQKTHETRKKVNDYIMKKRQETDRGKYNE